MRTIINYSGTFDGNMADSNRLKMQWNDPAVRSYRVPTSGSLTGSTRPEKVSAALWPILRGIYGYGTYSEVCLATSSEFGYAELKGETGSYQIACCRIEKDSTLKFSAACSLDSGALMRYDDSMNGDILTAAFLALQLSYDSAEDEIANLLSDLKGFVSYDPDADEWLDPATCEEFSQKLCILSQNLFYSAKDIYHDINIRSLSQIRQNDLKMLSGKDLTIFGDGAPAFLKISNSSQNLNSAPQMGTYAFGDPINAPYDMLIPDMPKGFVPPKWVLNICQDIQDSSDFGEPVRNILLSGHSGTGKTTGAMAIAYYTGKPYVKVTCSPDTDMFDMVGQMLPNVSRSSIYSNFQSLGVPSIDDIENDPRGAFISLFGHEMGPLDSACDCYREVFNRMVEFYENSSDYTYIESNFIRAIENGWVVEIQEPNVIKRNSVLVGLNGIMENDSSAASITLPTGKTIKRHKDAIVVITSNGGYDGVSPLQQSVLSRIQYSYIIEAPDVDEIVKRITNRTGFQDQTALRIMSKMMFDVQKYCKEKDITDGVCGPRELQNWAQKIMMIQKRNAADLSEPVPQEIIIRAAFSTFLYKISQDEENVEEVITAVFSKIYDQSTVNEAKFLYNAGEI